MKQRVGHWNFSGCYRERRPESRPRKEARTLDADTTVRARNQEKKCPDHMREGGGLRPGASATLTPTTALLENELVQETKGHRHVVRGHIDTVNGADGTVVRMWVLTERSKRTEAW